MKELEVSGIASSVEECGPVSRNLKVSVSAERVSMELDKAYGQLARKARVRGFRKGKVPRKVLEQQYGDEVNKDVLERLLDDACAACVREHQLDLVVSPRLVNHDYDPQTGLTFEASVDVRPKVGLGQYKGIKLDRKIVRVDDDHLREALQGLRERLAVLETEEDRVNVEPGDVVVMDMYAFVEGKPVDSVSGEGIQLEVGSGQFMEDFEKQIVGVTRGIRTPIVVNFPEDYGNEEIAGKIVRFEVTVRQIKLKVLPTLNDEFAVELGWEDCNTLDDLRALVRKDLEARSRLEADRRVRQELLDRVVDSTQMDVPPMLVEQNVYGMLSDMGLREVPSDKIEELKALVEPRAVRQVKAGFALDAIADLEGIAVTQDELRQRIRDQIVRAGEKAEDLTKYYSNPSAVAQLKIGMQRDKSLDCVMNSAVLTDIDVDPDAVADPGQTG
ncbi:MAG: trigger factor [Candidatus Binatia bacterium]